MIYFMQSLPEIIQFKNSPTPLPGDWMVAPRL